MKGSFHKKLIKMQYHKNLQGLHHVKSNVHTSELRGFFKKFPHFYIFAGNSEGGRSSNWSCLRVSCD